MTISYGGSHTVGNSFQANGTTGADIYTISSSTALLPVLPVPSIPGVSQPPGSGSGSTPTDPTVQTTAVTQQGGPTITLYGTSDASGDALGVNGKGGGDTFYLESLNIPATLTGNDANAPLSTPYTETYYIGYQGAGAPSSLAAIDALVTVIGDSGNDIVVLQDTADVDNQTFTFTSTGVISTMPWAPAGDSPSTARR